MSIDTKTLPHIEAFDPFDDGDVAGWRKQAMRIFNAVHAAYDNAAGDVIFLVASTKSAGASNFIKAVQSQFNTHVLDVTSDGTVQHTGEEPHKNKPRVTFFNYFVFPSSANGFIGQYATKLDGVRVAVVENELDAFLFHRGFTHAGMPIGTAHVIDVDLGTLVCKDMYYLGVHPKVPRAPARRPRP